MSHFTAHIFVPEEHATDQNSIDLWLHKVLDRYDENRQGPRRVDEVITREQLNEHRKSKYARDFIHITDGVEFLMKWTGLPKDEIKWNEADDTFMTYTYYNEESKWDWWTIGGRWSNFFGSTDIIKVVDIDWNTNLAIRDLEANTTYDEYERAAAGLEIEHRWSDLLERVEAGEMKIDAARDMYHSQPWYVAARSVMDPFMMEGVESYFMIGSGGREAFIKRERNKVGVPFAFIDFDGEWHEKGSMGWFGMTIGESAQDVWATEYFNYLEQVRGDQPNAVVVNVDCHI